MDRTTDSQEPLACAVTDDGITHRLWAVTDPAVQAAIAADLATRTALIADGHHRYAAYRELQAEMRAAGRARGRGTTASPSWWTPMPTRCGWPDPPRAAAARPG